jgi:hypothetical protein
VDLVILGEGEGASMCVGTTCDAGGIWDLGMRRHITQRL